MAGARLARYNIAALYTSDIVRAAETAAIVGAMIGQTPQPMPELREIDVGQWEGLTPEELYRRHPEHMQARVEIARAGGRIETLELEADPSNHHRLLSRKSPAEPHEFDAKLWLASGTEVEELAFSMAEPDGHQH